jgi:hypothetical protein
MQAVEVSKRQKKAVVSKRQKTARIWDKATMSPWVPLAEDGSKKKPGFKKVAKKIAAKQGIPEENARAILAAAARKASPAAKKANPALKKVMPKKSK